MRSKIKGIIAVTVLLACLSVALLFLLLSDDKSSFSDSSSKSFDIFSSIIDDEEIFPLTSIDKSSISKIIFENEHGSFSIVRIKKGTSDGEPSKWAIDGLSDDEQDISVIEECIDSCCALTADKMAEENTGDLSKYGLDKPSATVSISSDNQADQVFLIGNEIPTGGYRYIARRGSATVYTISNIGVDHFLQDMQYFINFKE